MIEITVLEHLSQALGLSVSMEYPEDPPDTFLVLRTGDTSRQNWLETTVFVVESYAPSMYEAAVLNSRAKAAMDALPELPEVSAAHLGTDYPANDTTNKRYRYQAVYNVTHY